MTGGRGRETRAATLWPALMSGALLPDGGVREEEDCGEASEVSGGGEEG